MSYRSLLLVAVFVVSLAACSKKQVRGQVFIVTEGQENIKLGLVGLRVLSDESFKAHAAQALGKIHAIEEARARQQAQYEADQAALEAFALDLKRVTAAGDFSEAGPLKEALVARVSALERPARSGFQAAFGLLGEGLGAPAAKTDADGRFKIAVTGKSWIIAEGQRKVGDREESYFWAHPYEPADKPIAEPLYLSSDNQLDEDLDSLIDLLVTASGTAWQPVAVGGVAASRDLADWLEVSSQSARRAAAAEKARAEAEAAAEKARVEAQAAAEKARVAAMAETWKQAHGGRAGEERVFEIAAGVKLTMCWIPAGEFVMGSSKESDATPHPVKLTQGFWLSQTEVTQAQWRALMGSNPSHFNGDELPVESVSWNAICGDKARTGGFLGKLNQLQASGGRFDLPTEAQWEYAARAGS